MILTKGTSAMRWVGDTVDFCQMNKVEKVALQALASTLPDDPLIVEVGTWLGGSVVLMHGMRPDARFIVIDGWVCDGSDELSDGTRYVWADLGGTHPRDLFLQNTRGIDVELHDINVGDPAVLAGRFDHVECDMYFDDAAASALPYFIHRVRRGGIVCGHDYYSQRWIDDAYSEEEHQRRVLSVSIDAPRVDAIAEAYGVEVNVASTLWWFRKHW